ncbi:MAG: hypothetical protein HY747_06505 [Elusimicrobia bacterium]|nr:hypothetical protein [Elusimicrobiota bacterium]
MSEKFKDKDSKLRYRYYCLAHKALGLKPVGFEQYFSLTRCARTWDVFAREPMADPITKLLAARFKMQLCLGYDGEGESKTLKELKTWTN